MTGQNPSEKNQSYLLSVAHDTWHCIGEMASASGLPYDNSTDGEYTSVSNIGMYLTSVTAARSFGFISQGEEEDRIGKTLDSLEKLKSWHGFQQSWNSVKTLQPSTSDTWVSVLDSGNLAAGLVTVSHAVPKYHDRCQKLFKTMDWSQFWDKEQHALIGGYNMADGKLNLKWHLDLLGSDSQLSQFFAIATGGALPELWEHLKRDEETKYGVSYYTPGWQGGGLFMQFISGLWLDERSTKIGDSARNFAFAQIQHQKEIKAPAWGWSACDNPEGGYLGWGALKDQVVTPHACTLAVEYFPQEAVANLHVLEKLGVRSTENGFFDAYDWKTSKHSDKFLILDQAMLFISLNNYLKEGQIRRWFQTDATVKRGRELIHEFHS